MEQREMTAFLIQSNPSLNYPSYARSHFYFLSSHSSISLRGVRLIAARWTALSRRRKRKKLLMRRLNLFHHFSVWIWAQTRATFGSLERKFLFPVMEMSSVRCLENTSREDLETPWRLLIHHIRSFTKSHHSSNHRDLEMSLPLQIFQSR